MRTTNAALKERSTLKIAMQAWRSDALARYIIAQPPLFQCAMDIILFQDWDIIIWNILTQCPGCDTKS
jgi:hypothetical protein